jgi:Flp pilus assembly protein TadG
LTFPSERAKSERGSSLVEFSLVAFLLVMLLIGIVEMCRMVLVYNDVAQAARAGVRYAIVHGSDNLASTTAIQTVAKNFLGSAPVNLANVGLAVNVSYPDTGACKIPGCRVKVTVTYPYDPLVGYFPITGVNLSSTSQGVITF